MTILNYSESRYYRHTGRAPFVGTTVATLAVWVAVALLGAGYAYVQLYVKVVDILSFLFVAAFAAAMAFTVYGVLKWAKVRNMAVTSLVAISAAILGMYVSWVAWEHALLRQGGAKVPIQHIFQRPDAVWGLAREINEEGTFTVRNRPVKGTELWIAWICETLAVLAATIALPVMWLRDMAFCESCARWCSKSEAVVRVAYNGYEEKLQDRMEAKDFDYLLSLGLVHFDTPVHVRVDLYACPGCPNTHLLTLSRVAVSYNNKGHRSEKATKIVDRLWLDGAQAQAVRDLPYAWERKAIEAASSSGANLGTSPTSSSS